VDDAVLPAGPWAAAAVASVLLVALSVPPGGPRTADARSGPGRLASPVGALLAVAVVLGARLGPDSELRNPVPALVVGLGWPLLLLLPALLGSLRPRLGSAADDVRPAVPAALAVVAFLVLPSTPTRPSAVGTAVAACALVVLAGCVAFGRPAVAGRFEVLGLLASWAAVGRALPRWAAPTGASAVLAVVLGGAWFERYERTTSWTQGVPRRGTVLAGLVLSLLLATAGAVLLHRAAGDAAAAVLLPVAVAAVVAGVLRRALISAQVLLDQAVGDGAVDPDPLGVSGGQALSLAVVAVGGALGAAVLARRRGEGADRLPGLGVVLALTAVSAWLVLQP
jgi:hypothetical protein